MYYSSDVRTLHDNLASVQSAFSSLSRSLLRSVSDALTCSEARIKKSSTYQRTRLRCLDTSQSVSCRQQKHIVRTTLYPSPTWYATSVVWINFVKPPGKKFIVQTNQVKFAAYWRWNATAINSMRLIKLWLDWIKTGRPQVIPLSMTFVQISRLLFASVLVIEQPILLVGVGGK